MRTIRTKAYKFNELTEDGKQKAIENLWDINVDIMTGGSIYSDAEEIGLKLTEFDIDRGTYCKGEFLLGANEVAQNIFNSHGESCETYKTAQSFMETWQPVFNNYIETEEGENELMDIENDFLNSLLGDYAIMLRNEYEYLTGKEAIIETIQANEYEFYANGKLI